MTKKKKEKRKKTLWKGMQRHFLTGVATLFPLAITVYIIALMIHFANDLIGKHINELLYSRYEIQIPGLGLVIALAGIFAVGIAYNYFFGRKVLFLFEKLFEKIPVISNIYPSVKQLSDFMFKSKEKKDFKKVVLVQFPEKGTYSIGFITNEKTESLNSGEKKLISVFVPLAPAPFSGHILLVSKDRCEEIDLSIDQAIKFIVSGGVVLPSDKSKTSKKKESNESS